MNILSRLFVPFLTISIALILSAQPTSVLAKNGTLNLSRLARYDSKAKIPQAVRDECDLESNLIESVQKYAEKNYEKVILVDSASAGTAGSALDIRITHALAPKGGTSTGLKGLTIRGTLWRNGKAAGSFTAKRVTTGGAGLMGTCSMLHRCTKKLGKDVARWLENPTMDARLGELNY
ncbi:MAG: hypothetical protein A2010_12295 [Nitrospirae bacterium GWD2_57_9]|nr:MAG: hypothetical protein A2010_12295 [Nitrospirae bacterium GWD2_57_9]OGW47948.1 MAG: hypothetical protein A2078_05255 [Nitrospirae bacterium GWC2_57_9]